MKQFWTHVVAGAAALSCAGAANAYVVNFESLDTSGAPFAPLLADGDYLIAGSYALQAFDANNFGDFNGSLVGQLSNGTDAGSCLDGACPAGNTTNYLSVLNNGIVALTGPSSLKLSGFDAAFLPPAGVVVSSGTAAYLAVEADRVDASYAIGIFSLSGPGASGLTSFASYAASSARLIGGTGSLTSGTVNALYFYSYYCDTSGSCSAFTSDRGQFAIDNISVNVPAVPEPSEWALMTLGLGAVGGTVRRRRVA